MKQTLAKQVTLETCLKSLDGTCDRICTKEIELGCEKYIPVSKAQTPIRRGRFAIFYMQNHYYGEGIG